MYSFPHPLHKCSELLCPNYKGQMPQLTSTDGIKDEVEMGKEKGPTLRYFLQEFSSLGPILYLPSPVSTKVMWYVLWWQWYVEELSVAHGSLGVVNSTTDPGSITRFNSDHLYDLEYIYLIILSLCFLICKKWKNVFLYLILLEN